MTQPHWHMHSTRLLARTMMHNEPNDAASRLRDHVFPDGTATLANGLRNTAVHGDALELLTSTSYYGVPYVWNVIRQDLLAPVTVPVLWKRLRRHWLEGQLPTTHVLADIPDNRTRYTINEAITQWERQLHTVEEAFTAKGILVSAILDPDADFVWAGHSPHPDLPHPLTATIRHRTWPLPTWQAPLPMLPHGRDPVTLVTAVLPVWAADQFVDYARIRRLPFARRVYPISLDSPALARPNEAISGGLALLAASITSPMTHEALLPRQAAAMAHGLAKSSRP